MTPRTISLVACLWCIRWISKTLAFGVGTAPNRFGKGKTQAVIFKKCSFILVYIYYYYIIHDSMKQHHNLPGGFWCGDLCCLMVIWGHTTQQIGDYHIMHCGNPYLHAKSV